MRQSKLAALLLVAAISIVAIGIGLLHSSGDVATDAANNSDSHSRADVQGTSSAIASSDAAARPERIAVMESARASSKRAPADRGSTEARAEAPRHDDKQPARRIRLHVVDPESRAELSHVTVVRDARFVFAED